MAFSIQAQETAPSRKRAASTTARPDVPLARGQDSAKNLTATDDGAELTPLSNSIAAAPLVDFQPGKTGMDSLFGIASVQVNANTASMPWQPVKATEVLGLSDAASRALDFSREIKVAEARVEQAENQVGQARGALAPSLIYHHSSGREESSPASVTDPATNLAKAFDAHRRTDETVSLKQPLFDPAAYSEMRRRKHLLDARQSNLQGTRGDEYVAVVQAFLSLTATRLGTELARDYEKQLNELFEYISRRAQAGVSTDADMQRVRARALTARAARIEQEGLSDAALVEFSRLTNILPKQLRLPKFEDLMLPLPANATEAVEMGIARSPEISALKAQLEATSWDKVAAKSRFLPRVDLELSDTKINNAGGPVGLQHDRRAMVTVNWSLLAGGTDYYYHNERAAIQEEIRWRLDDQQRRLIQGVSAQYSQLDATRARLAAGYKELSAISEAARAMGERMLAGNTSLMDLLDVLERLYQTRSRMVALHAQELNAGAQLGRYLGYPEWAVRETAADNKAQQ